MISAAIFLAVTPLPEVADLLDCAREARVTMVASEARSDSEVRLAADAGAAFVSIRVDGSDNSLVALTEATRLGLPMIVWPDGVPAGDLAYALMVNDAHRGTLMAAGSEAEALAIRDVAPDIGLLMTGITDHYEVLSSELDQRAMAAWFDYFPDAHMEYFLAGQGIETVIPHFPFSPVMSAEDFELVRQQHIEILITDQPEDAVAVFGRASDHCPAEGE